MSLMTIPLDTERLIGERLTNDILWWLTQESPYHTDAHIAAILGVPDSTWQALKTTLPWDVVTALRIADRFGLRVSMTLDI